MRTNRILIDQGTYRVSSRTVNLKKLFLKKHLQKDFKDVLNSARKKFKFDYDNLHFTPSGFILDIKPENGYHLSKIMQHVLGRFAQNFNRMFKKWGHFWGDRFVSEILEEAQRKEPSAQKPDNSWIKSIGSILGLKWLFMNIGKKNNLFPEIYEMEIELMPRSCTLRLQDFKIKKIRRIHQT